MLLCSTMGATFFLVAAVTRSAMAVKSIDMALLSDISVNVLMRPSAPSVEMLLTIGLRTACEKSLSAPEVPKAPSHPSEQ